VAADLFVHNVRPLGGDSAGILILAERIACGPAPAGVPLLDGGGCIALPGLVEAHTHLDKSLLGLPWYHNEVGPRLIDKIDNERNVRKALPIDPRRQSERQALLSVSHGNTFIRSHVDVDTDGRRGPTTEARAANGGQARPCRGTRRGGRTEMMGRSASKPQTWWLPPQPVTPGAAQMGAAGNCETLTAPGIVMMQHV
jgi:hypothetical protein